MTWPLVKLDSVAVRGSGHTPSQKHPEYWDGGVKWVSLADSSALGRRYIHDSEKKISSLGLRHSSAVLHPRGTVIVSRDAGVGKSAILGDEMAVSQHFIAWQCDEKSLHGEYLYQWLQSHRPEFERIAVGSTVKTIGLRYFKKLRIPLPPIKDQVRVATILADWDAAIEKTEQLIATKELYYTHELYRLINQGYHPLKHIGNERRAQLREFLTESRVLDTEENPSKRLTVRLHLQGVEARVVRGTESEGATTYYRRKSGQLIYGKQNIFRGAIGVIPAEMDGYCSTQDLPAFDISDGIDSQWLLYWLSRKSFYVALESLAAGSGSKRLHSDEFLRVSINVPDPDTQTAIACYLNALSEEISTLGVYVEKLKEQKRGLMQKLLTGQWRVRVDSDQVTA